MPNMLGIDAVKAIRERGVKTPIIMVTAEAEKGCVVEAPKAGTNNYVIKPFQPDSIITKIQDTLAKIGEGLANDPKTPENRAFHANLGLTWAVSLDIVCLSDVGHFVKYCS